MQILAIADIHGAFNNLIKVLTNVASDLIVIAGDLSPYGDPKGYEPVFDILMKYGGGRDVVVVAGNMDSPSLVRYKPPKENIKILHGEIVKIQNLLIIGFSGGLISPFFTYFELPDEELERLINLVKEKLNSLENNTLVIVSHTPPYNTKVDITFSGNHVGSKSLRKFIEELKPHAVICGHIHEARGYEFIGKTLILNPGPLFKRYYSVIELTKNEIKVFMEKI